jgi:hypothetical protein
MKKITLTLLALMMLSITSCVKPEDDDDNNCPQPGYGWFRVTNGSLGTVQRMMIDGTNYGTLDPGETMDIPLPAGEHDYIFEGISGGTGCSAATVTIVECQTEGRQCNY